jgi:hypothetical protein
MCIHVHGSICCRVIVVKGTERFKGRLRKSDHAKQLMKRKRFNGDAPAVSVMPTFPQKHLPYLCSPDSFFSPPSMPLVRARRPPTPAPLTARAGLRR